MATGDTLILSGKLELTSFFGRINFREHGMNAGRNLPVIQVQQRQPVVLFPPDIRLADFRR